jgi:hypothetical protein
MRTPVTGPARRLSRLLTGLIAILSLAETDALAAERYQEIELPWPGAMERSIIAEHPDLEVMDIDEGRSIRLLSRPTLTEALVAAGLEVAVVHDDLEAFYSARMSQSRGGGAFGEFYSYAEMVAELDAIHAAYPDITTDKIDIGTTWEGNTIWAMKISDNPDVEEDEPEVLIDALHHAREAITVSVVLASMRDLCENYGNDPEITAIVDERQVWFVPVVNPDGYLYNESTNPQGGGLWRKNRRDNGAGSCDGVDLNRNYSYEWGGPGSSGDTCSETYRGPSPFSEPETQALRDLMIAHEFITHDSFHSVVGVILYPWGYTSADSPDAALFGAISEGRIRDSGYDYGSAAQLLYLVSGGFLDYAYGETVEKPSIYSFSTEVDGSGFWPQESEIPGLVAENLYSNIFLAQVAGSSVRLGALDVVGGDGNGRLDPGETVDLVAALENAGVVVDAADISLTIESDDAYVQLLDATGSLPALAAGATGSTAADPFSVSADPATPAGYEALLRVHVTWDGGESTSDVPLRIGALPIIASDDFESGGPGWSIDPTQNAFSGGWVLVDPNGTEFQPEDDTTPDPGVTAWITGQNTTLGDDDVDTGRAALRSPAFDLNGYTTVEVSLRYFFGQRDPGDDTGDYFTIEISNDGGATFPADVLSIGDVFHAPIWQTLTFDVEDHVSLTDQVVLRITASDGFTTGDIIEAGIDDLVVSDGGTGNHAPFTPTPITPADGAVDQPGDLTLTILNATDVDGDPLTYGFRVYADELLTDLVRSVGGVAEGINITTWAVDPPLADGTYWWRAYAEDAEVRGELTPARAFTVGEVVDVVTSTEPGTFTVGAPSPNPFAYRTEIAFALPAAGRVRADVFDVTGRRVRSLYRGLMPAGQRVVAWDRRDQRGEIVGAGQYFVQVRLDGQMLTRKVVVLE